MMGAVETGGTAMRVGVFGTGVVGRTLAVKLASLGHETRLGTRDVEASLASTQETRDGTGTLAHWAEANPSIGIATFAEAAAGADLVFNATAGQGSVEALRAAGGLAGVVVVDVGNPLDFSRGMPPTLTISNDDSLAETLQREFPEARVVKALNTVTAAVMVDPASVGGGDHTMFVAGDDPEAKAVVREILEQGFGWRHVVDVGNIAGARGMEMYLPLWVALMGAQGTPMFNVRVVT
jgi:predicted dinucleotide-binding enzyme